MTYVSITYLSLTFRVPPTIEKFYLLLNNSIAFDEGNYYIADAVGSSTQVMSTVHVLMIPDNGPGSE